MITLRALPLAGVFLCSSAIAETFAVASIRPGAAAIRFERDGKTEIVPGAVDMRDVTVLTCIKWAYRVQDSQIVSAPDWVSNAHFDIRAKAEQPVAEPALKLMMQALLADRFGLVFHRANKELRSYVMTVAKGGHKLRPSTWEGQPVNENSAVGSVMRGFSMADFASYMAGPLAMPIVDQTGLPGRYDFTLDFTPYLPAGETVMKPDFDNSTGIVLAALQGELGLKLDAKKTTVEVLVIDRVEKPSPN